MSPLEITLIIIGIIVIAISCILVDNAKSDPSHLLGKPISSVEESLTEADKKKILDKMNDMLSQASEEAIIKTDDTLSKISNEKIMAVHEFSDQIIEKINRNHEEVVFLYNMLNDKEKELKTVIREIDTIKRKTQEKNSDNDRLHTVPKSKNQVRVKAASSVKQTMDHTEVLAQDATTLSESNLNKNAQILDLYSEGHSVIEISRLLGIGQGEVKLVIDLFNGKK
jgi:hypothetical protein